MSEDTIVAPTGRVFDSSGRQLAEWPDGMPGKFIFNLPKGETEFVIRIPQSRGISRCIRSYLKTIMPQHKR
ncbi:MAG: hypothetical protein EBE86_017785 [Hormoscilla sp. GUM202]|nr:hypothetical protein [Hormoscilla sp. GUM202]